MNKGKIEVSEEHAKMFEEMFGKELKSDNVNVVKTPNLHKTDYVISVIEGIFDKLYFYITKAFPLALFFLLANSKIASGLKFKEVLISIIPDSLKILLLGIILFLILKIIEYVATCVVFLIYKRLTLKEMQKQAVLKEMISKKLKEKDKEDTDKSKMYTHDGQNVQDIINKANEYVKQHDQTKNQ